MSANGLEEWLLTAARNCKCCVCCGDVPCAGCAAGGVCDEMECFCDADMDDDDEDGEE